VKKLEKEKQPIQLTLYARSNELEKSWKEILAPALKKVHLVVVGASEEKAAGKYILVDEKRENLAQLLFDLKKQGGVIILVSENDQNVPLLYEEKKVDDFVVLPFRPLEVLSKIMLYQSSISPIQAKQMASTFKSVKESLEKTVQVATHLQKLNLTRRFPSVKGLKVESRYLAGLRSGGDYFEIVESKDKQEVIVILATATSYKLAGAVHGAFTKSVEKPRDLFIPSFYKELQPAFKEGDKLHIFYGIISRKASTLHYILVGSMEAFYGLPGQSVDVLSKHGDSLTQLQPPSLKEMSQISLSNAGRLAVITEGFAQPLGNSVFIKLFNQFQNQEPIDLLNELAYKVSFDPEQGKQMPNQDATALVIETTIPIIQLSSAGDKNE
jgi:hypothetical protein